MSKRPKYETAADRAREAAVAAKLSKYWNQHKHEMPPMYPLDYAFTDNWGDVTRLVEIRCRTNRFEDYGTFMISWQKYCVLMQFQKQLTGKVYIVVQWVDALGWIDLTAVKPACRMGGRTDRKDPYDTEPMAHFSTTSFDLLERDHDHTVRA